MLIRGLRAFDQNGREVRRDSAGVHLHVHHATVMISLPSYYRIITVAWCTMIRLPSYYRIITVAW